MEIEKQYQKYKWFFTSSEKLVVGGKSAEQNEELLREIKKSKKEYLVMHTSHPGSPFSVIISDIKKVSKKDLEECAIFTGCFSRAWKEDKKTTEVHIFSSEQLYKDKRMKTGTWGVKEKVKDMKVKLELVLTKQKDILRAVPEISVKKENILLKVCPGKTDKTKMLLKFATHGDFKPAELLSALPAGGVQVCK